MQKNYRSRSRERGREREVERETEGGREEEERKRGKKREYEQERRYRKREMKTDYILKHTPNDIFTAKRSTSLIFRGLSKENPQVETK